MSFRDVTIARDVEQGDRVQMTSRTGGARRFWGGTSKKVRELELDAERDGWLFMARRGQTNLRATGSAWMRGQRKKPA